MPQDLVTKLLASIRLRNVLVHGVLVILSAAILLLRMSIWWFRNILVPEVFLSQRLV